MKTRRHSFTLMEVLLSLFLFGILLSSLFVWYRTLHSSHQSMGTQKWIHLQERYAQQQLESILPQADLSPYFFTSDSEIAVGPNLIFTFDFGPHEDPYLSSSVLGRLYIDEKLHALCLGIWPHPSHQKQEPTRTLVLLEGVTQLAFEFYFPPNPFRKTVEPEEVGRPKPQVGWQRQWRQAYHCLPPLMKIHMLRLNEQTPYPLTYAFELSRTAQHMTYKQD